MSETISLKNKKIALIGCGDIGCRLATQMLDEGAEVKAYRRTIDNLPKGVVGVRLDVTDTESLKALADESFDYIVVTLSPSEMSDEAYKSTYVDGLGNILAALNQERLSKLFWVSSSSVYGQSDGSWIDETSMTEPTRYSGKRQLEAEQLLGALADKACIVRFSGIYREGKHRLVEQIKAGKLGDNIENDYYTNRIHVKDCASVLAHLIQLDAKGQTLQSIYLASDSAPVKYSELIHWLASELGKGLNTEAATQTPRVGSKRCSNKRLLESGYQFNYPTYREGFAEIIQKE